MHHIRIIFLLTTLTISYSQNKKSIFDVARLGNVGELMALYHEDNSILFKNDSNGFSPLILATYNNNLEVALKLIELKSDLDYISPMGTALMASVYKNNREVFNALLNRNVLIDEVDQSSNTALILAVYTQNEYMVEQLLKKNPDRSITNREKKTAFMLALESNNAKIIELFNNN